MHRTKYMKKIQKLKFYTFDEVFGNLLKSKKNREIYEAKLGRLRLIRQIRELRHSKRLTQKTFATKVGMSQSVIARLESGKHSFSMNTLYQIAGAFGKKIVLT